MDYIVVREIETRRHCGLQCVTGNRNETVLWTTLLYVK